ncbi:zinc finger BED domain-containing protein 4-like [Dicentrarchus labrax]|uniref:zinc finger BED domain-containing protein 4-like n=1 Tax=Dicentrarchus labrax TaxID=13489 RepID=UPI0021F5C6D9|nr:zinc finger BED domain-containing protein 4-like [Dicentrarchus labrax]XP_051244085.1 zinc finger BED domain-containing protein 4-like [Dicentrarchus labrax]XP_051244095.1 zinc finger BED domain-containing protein 4-like [Dicentrarchus labrax]
MVVKDSQPFSIVDDCGFKEFVALLDPTYSLPSQRAQKNMVVQRYEVEKTKAKAVIQRVEAVSLTADMWTSINMDAYLAVTGHYLDESVKLATVLLGVLPFPEAPTAANITAATRSLMEEWSIEGKVTSIVTDAGANMVASVRSLNLRHALCFAHSLNLVVKKSLDATPGLEDLRTRARKVVTLFKTSTTAREKLKEVQEQMNRPVMKLIQEVDTHWNSTFLMLQRLFKERQSVGAALATLKTDVRPLSSETASACLQLLGPFYQATVELSEEKRVSGSKVIPMIKMLMLYLYDTVGNISHNTAKQLGQNLVSVMLNKFDTTENQTALNLSTLLDPRFKTLGFYNQVQAQSSVKRLTAQCSQVIRDTPTEEQPSTSDQPANVGNPPSTDINLWATLDRDASEARRARNATADATVEVQRYMVDPPLERSEDPLDYWSKHRNVYPHLYILAKQFLRTPASSVPCERVFSKCG